MTKTKRDFSDLPRKLQLPVLLLASFAPLLLFLAAQAIPDRLWLLAYGSGAYVLLAWCNMLVPGRIRVVAGGIFTVVLTAVNCIALPVAQSPQMVLAAICFVMLMIYSMQFGAWSREQELHLALPCMGLVLHLFLQFMISLDGRGDQPAQYTEIAAAAMASFLVYLLLAVLSMKRDNMTRAVNGGSRAPVALRRRNTILTVAVLAVAVVLAAMPAVIDAFTRVWDAAWGAVATVVHFLVNLIPDQENVRSDAEPGQPGGGGLVGNWETSWLAALMEKLMLIAASIAFVLLLLWALRVIWRKLRVLLRYLLERLRQYAAAASEDYVDEISDTREDGTQRESMLAGLLKRMTMPRVDEKTLPPRERMRYFYRKLIRRHPEWRISDTAREKLPEAAAVLYERARYSTHDITDDDAEHFRRDTKGV